MIAAIKLLHSLIYLFMSACVGYLLYAAASGTRDRLLALAVGAILLETVVLLANGRRCPLSTLARRLGDETGDDLIADLLLPRWAIRLTVPVCGLLATLGLVVVLLDWLF